MMFFAFGNLIYSTLLSYPSSRARKAGSILPTIKSTSQLAIQARIFSSHPRSKFFNLESKLIFYRSLRPARKRHSNPL